MYGLTPKSDVSQPVQENVGFIGCKCFLLGVKYGLRTVEAGL